MELLQLSPWVEHLIETCETLDGRIYATIPDDDLSILRHESPSAFVYLSGDDTSENDMINSVRHQLTVNVSIDIIIRRAVSINDYYGVADTETLRECRAEILDALLGWRPPDAAKRIAFAGGALKSKEKRVIKWTDNYTTRIILQSRG